MLRVTSNVTFTAGDGALPAYVLERFLPDATFYVGTVKYSFHRYPDWLRGGDSRLGTWTVVGETMKAKTPQPVGLLTGTGAFSAICSPAIPATEDDEFVAPEDYVSDFLDAMTQYILGQPDEVAAQTA